MVSKTALPWQHVILLTQFFFQNLVPQKIVVKVATFGW